MRSQEESKKIKKAATGVEDVERLMMSDDYDGLVTYFDAIAEEGRSLFPIDHREGLNFFLVQSTKFPAVLVQVWSWVKAAPQNEYLPTRETSTDRRNRHIIEEIYGIHKGYCWLERPSAIPTVVVSPGSLILEQSPVRTSVIRNPKGVVTQGTSLPRSQSQTDYYREPLHCWRPSSCSSYQSSRVEYSPTS
jgi:hypothetical protein